MSDTVELKYKEEDLKLLAGFTLLDDDFMTIVFDRNIEATELVLNIILGRNDLKIQSQEAVPLNWTFMQRILTEKYTILRYRMMMPGQTYTEPDSTVAC